MSKKRILVVDDLPEKLRYLTGLTKSAQPESEVITATSAREAIAVITEQGRDQIDAGVIDFDLDNGCDGGDVIAKLRSTNTAARIALATARRENSFEDEAKPIALYAGADEALSTYQEDFECQLSMMLAA
ncbi:MAG: response regulator [Candidatus Peregrinibacteria bacterium]